VSQFDGERNRARKQIAVAARPHQGVRAAGANEQRPDDGLVGPRSDLDLVRARLAPDLGAPRLAVADVFDRMDHLTACQQLAATAMIDRLIHHAEILSLKGDSYRLRGKDLDARISAKTAEIA
jgi:hypothetical protein